MRSRSSKASVAVALGASAAVHLIVIVPLMLAMMAATGSPQRVEAQFSSADLLHDDDEKRETSPKLGIEESTASTFTWIGYEDYEEHLARLAEIEQAAFTDEPTGEHALTEAQQVEARKILEQIVALDLPSRLPEIDLTQFARISEAVGLLGRESEATEIVPEPTPIELATVEPSPEDDPAEPASPGEPADAADKQSEATSLVEVSSDQWRLGRPVAAEGVELKPQRPHFSIMQRLTSLPCNPLVEMRFSRAGVTTLVNVVQSSGDPTIDAAIEASAYRWRAEGEAIDELSDDATFNVQIRFVLTASSRCP